MPVGKKKKLTLQQYTDTINARGANVRTWADVREIKGVFCGLSPREMVLLSKETMFKTYKFHVTYQKELTTAVSEKDRFKLGTRYFEITGIKDPDEQNIMQTFYLQEIV